MTKDNKTFTSLYRRNNQGQPCGWRICCIGPSTIEVEYGILGKTITSETINTSPRSSSDELKTRVNTKRKNGYLSLADVSDNVILPVEDIDILAYLDTYLPYDRQSSTGAMLPQLAKLYDNTNDKLYKNEKYYIVQYKINGLRCLIGAKLVATDLFRPVRLTFQSREGTYWNSLENLEDYLLKVIPEELILLMANEGWLLDGELYIPGETVNDMNSIVKNVKNDKNKLVQYWCYDLAVPEISQFKRFEILHKYISQLRIIIMNKTDHDNNKKRFVYIGNYYSYSHTDSLRYRDVFIKWGFEGGIGRDPIADYQFGKRNSAMWKYKATTDGKFLIIDIQPEGDKREGIPLLTLRNDINNEVFKVHVSGSFEYQKSILNNWRDYISRYCYVEYGERSGVNQLPFHVKNVTILEKGD